MGTEIQLAFGGMSLGWAKNHRGPDHGALFQEGDRRAVHCDQINYDFYKEHNEDPTPMEMAFVSKLKNIAPRLELLGFTLEQARRTYEHWIVQCTEERQIITEPNSQPIPDPLSFDEFRTFVNSQSITELDNTYLHENDFSSHHAAVKGRFAGKEATINRIPHSLDHDDLAWSERSYFWNCIDILHPYLMLRILAENAVNMETEVIWQYGPLVENGWARVAEFTPHARRRETFLIATEGSSDAHILRHAFQLLRPEISDFFRFIDVSDRHPFPGTGNLVKFAEGLAKIDVQNQVVFVFDNDAEGTEAFHKLSTLSLPPNMRTMVLPSLDKLRSFAAKGPEGVHMADINGRAAAIECYLDHRQSNSLEPRVIWSTYKKETDTYQGALEQKEHYTNVFLSLTPDKLTATRYDTNGISKVLDALITQCTLISAARIINNVMSSDY